MPPSSVRLAQANTCTSTPARCFVQHAASRPFARPSALRCRVRAHDRRVRVPARGVVLRASSIDGEEKQVPTPTPTPSPPLDGALPPAEPEAPATPPPTPEVFLVASTGFYAGLVGLAAFGGTVFELNNQVLLELAPPWGGMGVALLWTLPLLGTLAMFEVFHDRLPAVAEIKALLYQTMGIMAKTPVWGLALLAAGAGIGEEAFFRGFLQSGFQQLALRTDVAPAVAQQAALWGASVIFGLLHAVTPLYLVWATLAGALLGWEYIVTGSLPAAALTHGLYDFMAFVWLVRSWKAAEQSSTEAEQLK